MKDEPLQAFADRIRRNTALLREKGVDAEPYIDAEIAAYRSVRVGLAGAIMAIGAPFILGNLLDGADASASFPTWVEAGITYGAPGMGVLMLLATGLVAWQKTNARSVLASYHLRYPDLSWYRPTKGSTRK